jgi:phenylpyruvate tautomerase PptA (4-oxalocrotonate tautomerase family)
MPQLIIQGLSVEQVKKISKPLVKELAEICSCGDDNFIIEVKQSIFVFNVEEISTYPFIEVKWFDRGQIIRNQFADSVTKHVMSLDIDEIEVAFTTFKEEAYYINGKSCTN